MSRAVRRSLASTLAVAALSALPVRAADPPAPVTVHVAVASPNPVHLAFWIAEAKGYFADQGIQIDAISMRGGPSVAQALTAGRIDVGLLSVSTTIQSWNSGKTPIVVAGLSKRAISEAIVSTAFLRRAGVTPAVFAKLPIAQRLRLLKGSRWGVTESGGLDDDKIRILAKAAGLDPDRDLQIEPVGNTESTVDALLNADRIDAAFANVPDNADLTDAGTAVPLIDRDKPEEFPDVALALQSQIVVDAGWAAGHAAIVRRFNAAIVRASAYAHTAPAADVAAALHQTFPEVSEERLLRTVRILLPIVPDDARLPQSALVASIDIATIGSTARRPRPGDIYTDRYLPH